MPQSIQEILGHAGTLVAVQGGFNQIVTRGAPRNAGWRSLAEWHIGGDEVGWIMLVGAAAERRRWLDETLRPGD